MAAVSDASAAVQRAYDEFYGEAAPLTDAEQRALGLTGELAKAVSQIVGAGTTRDADLAELYAHIHAVQHAVMAQAAARAYPALYRPLGGDWNHAAEPRP